MEAYLSPKTAQILIELCELIATRSSDNPNATVAAHGIELGRIAENLKIIFEAGGKAGLKITTP